MLGPNTGPAAAGHGHLTVTVRWAGAGSSHCGSEMTSGWLWIDLGSTPDRSWVNPGSIWGQPQIDLGLARDRSRSRDRSWVKLGQAQRKLGQA